jgi:hypothetical protein
LWSRDKPHQLLTTAFQNLVMLELNEDSSLGGRTYITGDSGLRPVLNGSCEAVSTVSRIVATLTAAWSCNGQDVLSLVVSRRAVTGRQPQAFESALRLLRAD